MSSISFVAPFGIGIYNKEIKNHSQNKNINNPKR